MIEPLVGLLCGAAACAALLERRPARRAAPPAPRAPGRVPRGPLRDHRPTSRRLPHLVGDRHR
jgi:hypothetical protein